MKAQKISAESINNKVFGTEISGYKMESVNEFLDEVAKQILDNEEEIELLIAENTHLKKELQQLKNEINDYQSDIQQLHEQKKALTKEKLVDLDIFKSIRSMETDISVIKKILENLQKA